MKEFKKIYSYVIPYWSYALLNISFNIISVFFALFSMTMVIPFLGILFRTQPLVTNLLPFSFSFEILKHDFYYLLSKIIINYGEAQALVMICIIVTVATLLKTGFNYLASYYMSPIMNGVVKDIHKKIYDKILILPLSYYSEERKGDILARITNDVQEIKFSIMSSLDMVFRDPLTIIIFISMLIFMSFELSIFILVFFPISGLIIGRIGKTLKSTSLRGQHKMGDLLSLIEETLSGLRIIKAFNAENVVIRKFKALNNQYYIIMNTVTRQRSLSTPLGEFLGTFVMVTVMWYGGSLVLGKESYLSPASFIGYLIILSQIIPPVKSLSNAYYNIQKGAASIERISHIIDAEVKIIEKPDAIPINEFKKEIEYKNISFTYQQGDEEWVLRNINLKIERGRTVALVGQSGGGKTTLADLLPRFHLIESGEILVDGVNIEKYRITDLRDTMSIVTQESILFNDTIFNNIALGKDIATMDEVVAAAKVANAHNFIMEMENQYQSNIGDRGCKLSGGQRQRLCIARAVLKNPAILILDEATSSLDTESERLVQDAIFNLMKNRTSIVIAHRLSTIKNADEICVIHKGEIVEKGTHTSLLEKEGYYKKLFDMQMFS
ncbi:MAG: ABC transporter transmembrane domain-containing protein [Bacteroidales bacterium]|nr:ABC transporter transmembrane domain-containing protein [Bacteroidales bacterium]